MTVKHRAPVVTPPRVNAHIMHRSASHSNENCNNYADRRVFPVRLNHHHHTTPHTTHRTTAEQLFDSVLKTTQKIIGGFPPLNFALRNRSRSFSGCGPVKRSQAHASRAYQTLCETKLLAPQNTTNALKIDRATRVQHATDAEDADGA